MAVLERTIQGCLKLEDRDSVLARRYNLLVLKSGTGLGGIESRSDLSNKQYVHIGDNKEQQRSI